MSYYQNPGKVPFLFAKQFEHCNVKRGETIALLTDSVTPAYMVQGAFAAAEQMGAHAYELKMNTVYSTTHSGTETVLEPKGTLEVLQKADLILVFHVALGTQWLAKVVSAGARVLFVLDEMDVLERVMPVPGLKEALLYARDLLGNAKEMRVTNAAGTDFVCGLGTMRASCQYGAADAPGRIDGWGRGHFATYATPGTARGKVVLQPGDCWIYPYVRYVEAATTLTIEGGKIVAVDGATDAALIRQFMKAHSDHEGNDGAYFVSHLGWGLHPNTPVDQLAVFGNDMKRAGLARGWPGVFLFSTGPDAGGGGSNATPGHIDLPMFGCTITVDGKVVIEDGKVVDPRMIVQPTHPMTICD